MSGSGRREDRVLWRRLPHQPIRARLIGLTLAAGLIAVWLPQAAAAPEGLRQEHHGIVLMATPVAPGTRFDTTALPAAQGLSRIAAALDRLFETSAHSAARIRTLLRRGQVTITYDPADMKNGWGGETIAAFFPAGDERQSYRVVVGRHLVKWPIPELAATLAHELSGHGVQHRDRRLRAIRYLDAECEANLHE